VSRNGTQRPAAEDARVVARDEPACAHPVPSFRRGHARRAARDFLSPEFREAAISDSGALRSPHVHDVRLVDTFAVTFRDSTKF